MAASSNYFVIAHDAGHDLPYGFAWFVDLGRDPRGGSAFTYFATRDDCVAFANAHTRYTNPVLLDDDAA